MMQAGENPIIIGPPQDPTPGTSKAAGDGYVQHAEVEGDDDDFPEVPDNAPGTGEKRKDEDSDDESHVRYDPDRFKNKKPKTVQQNEKKNQFLESISKSLDSMVTYIAPQPANTAEDDYDLAWAKLLVPKIKMMPIPKREKFKVKVDNMALEGMEE